jgi:hypothetical protein
MSSVKNQTPVSTTSGAGWDFAAEYERQKREGSTLPAGLSQEATFRELRRRAEDKEARELPSSVVEDLIQKITQVEGGWKDPALREELAKRRVFLLEEEWRLEQWQERLKEDLQYARGELFHVEEFNWDTEVDQVLRLVEAIRVYGGKPPPPAWEIWRISKRQKKVERLLSCVRERLALCSNFAMREKGASGEWEFEYAELQTAYWYSS